MTTTDLTHPPAGTVRILPLGGCGEIGMNMTVFETTDDIIIVDCGVMFPEAHMLGVDLLLPDIAWLKERIDKIRGLILTHGHEDHIGSIPYLIGELGMPPIYGTKLTLGMVGGKLREFELDELIECHQIEARKPFTLGDFAIEPFTATHSIVDGVGFAIRTPAGLIVHSGDFKIDHTPVDGKITDLARLSRYGEEGVLLLLSDSTNVERAGCSLSERVVGEAFADIFPRCEQGIIVSSFSSNIHRVQQIADAAIAADRRILLEGRSMISNCAIARELDLLHIPDEALLKPNDYRRLQRSKTLVITTGSQGEAMSALSRISHEEHKVIQIEEGDTVILSSKQIPGNERAIGSMINRISRLGAEVIYERTSEIHVSGHACQEELKTMLSLTKPRFFMPIHGEYRHLKLHCNLANDIADLAAPATVIENGTPLLVSDNGIKTEDRIASGRVIVDGKGVGDIGAIEMRDRRALAYNGTLIVLLALNRETGELLNPPELVIKGVIPEEAEEAMLTRAKELICELLDELPRSAKTDSEELRVEVRKVVRRYFNKELDRRPLILPIVIEL